MKITVTVKLEDDQPNGFETASTSGVVSVEGITGDQCARLAAALATAVCQQTRGQQFAAKNA